ncbi:fumarylacetoacetate hydrolase family protein [Bradyrhizobium jicamae]|uniref:fumarylacetoacetate hydrolase family protein n=1 Tax=Bradyrhizobium jicamae TaxID=280332 RepID=UPI001BA50963|nr:fumarylacetoacetate hydrolase family protein [Bradyrhizobium jicamae]MBR0755327.1 fumarylacetoacetate hydrolase family protein [Bradyrhizobium jicamae]
MTDSTIRLGSYRSPSGPRACAIRSESVFDLQSVLGIPGSSNLLSVFEDWHLTETLLRSASFDAGSVGPLAQTELLAPILYPRAMFCAGANYADHVEEMARVLGIPASSNKENDAPWHFVATPAHSIVGPNAAIEIPAYAATLDWEAELGAVIGRPARNVSVDTAMSHVAGLTIVNDLSARDHSRRANVPVSLPFHWDWMSQKCFEGAKPVGPWITLLRDVGDVYDMPIRLWVDGVIMQESNTSQMIFTIAEQIAFLSTRLTLLPGDIIATGTPAGVGIARGTSLRGGEEVRIEIERIGELTTKIKPRPTQPPASS